MHLIQPTKPSLLEISEQIRLVADDPRVKGVIFHLRPMQMSLAKMDVLRSLLFELKSKGKHVVTWSYEYDTAMYYLAVAADEIILVPGGTIAPLGLYRQFVYLAKAFEKVGISADFVQITPYKSAGDIYSREEMSSEVREMSNWLADSIFDELVSAISDGRKIDWDTAISLVNQTPCTDIKAIEVGAVDSLLGEDGLPSYLGDEEEPCEIKPYYDVRNWLFSRPVRKPGKYIAVMSVQGMIIDGRSTQPPVKPPIPFPIVMDERAGDLSVVSTVRRIMSDKNAAGAIIYVNSRGGSATASESMRISLEKLAKKVPLVVVMGPVAASGGYWVSTPGAKIFAQATTITGSIGVISGKIAASGLLEKLFINQEVISRGEHARIYQPEAPFSEEERIIVWDHIKRIYDLFLDRVSINRDMTLDEANRVGGGRVWTGRQALEKGLVDEIGGFDQALEYICKMAGLDKHSQVRFFYPEKRFVPPISEPASLLKFGYEGLKILKGKTICYCPWMEIV
jgi:protease-4